MKDGSPREPAAARAVQAGSPHGGLFARVVADERVRFVAVGAFNTALGYVLFVGLEALRGVSGNYYASLIGSYLVATLAAFFLHRRVTFSRVGRESWLRDFVRFQAVYLVILLANAVALPILIDVAGLSPIVAQGMIVAFATVASYLGHKYVSFARA